MIKVLALVAGLGCVSCFCAATAGAANNSDVAPRLTWGGFVDTYYAYDFSRPTNHERLYTTQPVRHNEFNINLAFLEAKVAADRVRGRLALQAGTSVQSNYAGEPSLGTMSGPTLARHIQEAYGGYRIADRVWVDAGILFSHIGLESFISRDNWAYTRSLMSDYSPYYQTGVRLSVEFSDAWSAQLNLINGWQNISENNEQKALGIQLVWKPSEKFSTQYSNFLGVEGDVRFFNDWIARLELNALLSFAAVFDLGIQKTATPAVWNTWWVAALLARFQWTPSLSSTLRGEYYSDPQQVIVATGSSSGFQTFGTSVGLDWQLHPAVRWRNEFRAFYSMDPVFNTQDGATRLSPFLVTSLGLSF